MFQRLDCYSDTTRSVTIFSEFETHNDTKMYFKKTELCLRGGHQNINIQ